MYICLSVGISLNQTNMLKACVYMYVGWGKAYLKRFEVSFNKTEVFALHQSVNVPHYNGFSSERANSSIN